MTQLHSLLMRRTRVLLARHSLAWIMATCIVTACSGAGAAIRVHARTAFDSDYFYVAADVEKAVLRGTVSAPFHDPYQDDCIAVFLAAGSDSISPDESDTRVEMAVSVAGGAQLYRGKGRVPLSGVDDFRVGPDGTKLLFKYRLRPRGALNGPPDTNNGFTVEMAIPWTELSGPPKPGEVMRFNVAVLNTVEGEAPLASLSPDVKTRDDVQNAHLWGRMVFADAPVASIAGVPGGIVCARVFNVRPVIDGAIAEGEWSRVTAFSFADSGGGARIGMGTAAAARSRAPVALKAGTMPSRIVRQPTPPREHALAQQQWPRLVFARYRVDYQCDTRKALPLRAVADASGQTLLATHPMDGTGPWFTYDRPDWHRIQFTRMREAGVDVAAVTFRPGREGRLAATAIAAALQGMAASGMDYPSVCLWLDTSAMKEAAYLASRLERAVRQFHECIPEQYIAQLPLVRENGIGTATIVVLSGLSPEGGQALMDELRARLRADLGRDVLLLSAGKEIPGADGLVPAATDTGFATSERGIATIGSIYAGAIGRAQNAHPLARKSSEDYRAAWRRLLSQPPDWVFIESWNDHAAGTEIAPTVEFGLEYTDITRAFSLRFSAKGPFGGSILGVNLPPTCPAGGTVTLRVSARNQGTSAWSPEDTAFVAFAGNTAISSPAPVAAVAEPGARTQVVLSVSLPRQEGVHELTIALVRLDRKGKPLAPSPLTRAALGVLATRIVSADHLLPAATLVASSLTRVVEAQSTYPVAVTLRNDGPAPWPRETTAVRIRLLEQPEDHGEPVVLDMADASVPIPSDVSPGSEVDLTIPTTFARPDGSPFRFSSDTSGRYLVRVDVDLAVDTALTLPTTPREVEMAEADMGVQFFNDYTPGRFPAERRIPVIIGVRNRGPQTWLRDQVAVGYHWYYFDGLEAVWEDEVFTIKTDVPPGKEIADVGASVTAPPHDGTYWLVWDLRVGDTWVSTLPGNRTYETRVSLVQIVNGRLRFVDLKSAADVHGASGGLGTKRPDFDGSGDAYPAELTPPYALNLPVPATLWMPEIRTGTARSRQISFAWLPASGPNAVRCRGQEIPVATPKQAQLARRVHILAAAVRAGQSLSVTLRFADSSEQFMSFPVSVWNGPPANTEAVAHAMPYSRISSADGVGPAVSVFWYTVEIKEPKPLVAITLGDAPDVRVLAITAER